MKFPAYWSQATAEETDASGERTSFSCWRWSDTSQEESHSAAIQAAKRILAMLLRGETLDRYGYGSRPLREEVLERLTDSDGVLTAAITRNAWGALVLNTAGAMFIDIDFPPISPGEWMRHFFRKWFDKSSRAPDLVRQQQALERLAEFAGEHSDWSVRVYRTHSGLRALATHQEFDPKGEDTRTLLERLGSDPLYIRLCRDQECFRARLTPKPWRCRHDACGVRWPRQTKQAQDSFAYWQSIYLDKQARYATCRYLDTLGSGVALADFARIIELHDQLTRADEPLELA